MQRIADQKSQIAENDRALQEREAQIRDLTADEDRIRQNIQSLNNVSGQQQQVQNYARQIGRRTNSNWWHYGTNRRSCKNRKTRCRPNWTN